MTAEEIRTMLTGGSIQPPFTVHTVGGQSYEVTDVANIWTPPALPHVVAIAVPRKALAVVRLEMIDSITCEEHEAVASGRK